MVNNYLPKMKWRWRYVFLILGLLPFVAGIGLHYYYKWSLSKYKAELAAKGFHTEISKLTAPPCADKESARIFYSAFRSFPPLPDNLPRMMEQVAPGKARVAWKETVLFEQTRDK